MLRAGLAGWCDVFVCVRPATMLCAGLAGWCRVCVCQTSDHAPCRSCRLMCLCVSDQWPCSVRVLPADVMCLCMSDQLNGLNNLHIPTTSPAICFFVFEDSGLSAETCSDTEQRACPQAASFLSQCMHITPSTYVYTSFVSDLVLVAIGKTLYYSIACCIGCILHGHVAIITKPSPHYVLTESTDFISHPWRKIGRRPGTNTTLWTGNLGVAWGRGYVWGSRSLYLCLVCSIIILDVRA